MSAPLVAAPDVPLQIVSENAVSERRVSPAWSIAQFKARLEPITGIPASSQSITIKHKTAQSFVPIKSDDEDTTFMSAFGLQAYTEIHVTDTRPPNMRTSFTDTSSIEKYEMPMSEYERKTDSVLAYKKAHQLGRFDPSLPSEQDQQRAHIDREIMERKIVVGARCRLLPAETDDRRGEIAFVGPVDHIPGLPGSKWIGIKLDEPTGKNDGSLQGTKYFDAGGEKRGVFVRAEKVEVGDFKNLDDELDSDMEEI